MDYTSEVWSIWLGYTSQVQSIRPFPSLCSGCHAQAVFFAWACNVRPPAHPQVPNGRALRVAPREMDYSVQRSPLKWPAF